jgi:hypothetical protein
MGPTRYHAVPAVLLRQQIQGKIVILHARHFVIVGWKQIEQMGTYLIFYEKAF